MTGAEPSYQSVLDKREEVIDDKHPEQGDGEPVAALGGRMEVGNDIVKEVGADDGTVEQEEHSGGDNLHTQLLQQELPQVVG